MTSIYRPILKQAWHSLWRAKYLWFFGLFAVLVSNSGEFILVINNFSSLSEQNAFLTDLKTQYSQGLLGNFGENVSALFSNFSWSVLLLVILLLALFILILWIAITAQGGLISGAYKEYRRQAHDFGSSFKVGRNSFWRVLGINVVGKVVIYGIFLIVGIPLTLIYLKQASNAAQLIFMLLSFIILIPLAVIISFLIKYAVIYAVIKKESVWQAIRSGWNLFIKNWVISIEMAILMFLVSVLTGIIMIGASIALAIPLALLMYLFYSMGVGGLVLLTIVVALFLFILLLLWLGALLITYQMTCWTLLFDRLDGGAVFPKIARVVAGWTSKKKDTGLD